MLYITILHTLCGPAEFHQCRLVVSTAECTRAQIYFVLEGTSFRVEWRWMRSAKLSALFQPNTTNIYSGKTHMMLLNAKHIQPHAHHNNPIGYAILICGTYCSITFPIYLYTIRTRVPTPSPSPVILAENVYTTRIPIPKSICVIHKEYTLPHTSFLDI